MLSLRLHPDRQLRFHDEPIPEPGRDELLIRVTEVGLCGSDRHWLMDGRIGDAVLDRPLVLGHEFAGIVAIGAGEGRRVAVDPTISCGRCEPCRTGSENLCSNTRFAGHGQTDGALREYIAWPVARAYPLSDRVETGVGALIEPLAVAIHSLDLGHIGAGATVGVIGCGPIGLLLVALCRSAGASTIVASDPQPHRGAAAAALGADQAITASGSGNDGAAFLAATAGRGMDVVFDAAGEPAAVEGAIAAARPGGRVVLVGIPADDRTTFTASVARRKGLTLLVSRRSTSDTFRRAVEVAENRSIDLSSLITLRVPLAQATQAFEALIQRGGVKTIVEPSPQN